MYIRRFDGANGHYQLQTTVGPGNSGTLSLQTYGGDVGIGTTSPSFNLHVNSASNGVTAIGVGNTGTGASRIYLDASNGDFAGSDYMWIGQNNDLSGEIFMPQSAGSFHIKTQPGGTATTQFTVNQAGNVGIGSSSPAYKLDVAGDIQNNGVFRKGGNVIIKSTGSETMIGPGGSGIITFHNSATMTAGDETVRIDASGNLMLNNTSAGARLDIREDTGYAIRAENASGHYFRVNTGGDTEIAGDLTVAGTITAQEFHTELVSASIVYESGSTKFGNSSDDNHDFTGSLNMLGSINSISSGVSSFERLSINSLQSWSAQDLGSASSGSVAFRINGRSGATNDFIVSSNGTTNYTMQVVGNATTSGQLHINPFGGNVGIGTTNAVQKLQVDGSIYSNGGEFFVNGDKGITAVGNLLFKAHNGTSYFEGMRLSSAGNVGIGTTNPDFKLQIATPGITSGSTYSWPFDLTRAGTSATRGFSIGVGTAGGNVALGNHNGDMSFGHTFGNDSNSHPQFYETMRIQHIDQAVGRVGIGTSSPSKALHISSGNADQLLLENSTSSGTARLQFKANSTRNAGPFIQCSQRGGSASDSDLQLGDETGTILTLNYGRAGIGTSSPKQLFHLSGGSTSGDVTKAVIGATGGNAESHLYLAENFSGENVNWGFSFVADGNSSNNLLIKRHSNNTSGTTVLTINRDNNNASFSGELQVASNLDINGTSLTLSSAAITYQNNNDVDTGTETIATVVKANYDAAFFDYVVKNGTNLRAGTVMAVHDGTNVEFTDNSTKDIGNTSGVTFSVDISGTDLRLRATTTSDNWVIKTLVKTL